MSTPAIQVLWIDDDVRYQEYCEELLGLPDIPFVYKGSVEEAVQAVEGQEFVPIVILDAIVPLQAPRRGGRIQGAGRSGGEVDQVGDEPSNAPPVEKNGRVFVDVCKSRSIKIGRTIVMSFVGEPILREVMGYSCDHFFQKLRLPDEIVRLRQLVAETMRARS